MHSGKIMQEAKPTRIAAVLSSPRARATAGWAAVAWAAGIALLSHLPEPPAPGPEFPLKDKVGHLLLYAVLGFLSAAAAARPGRRRRTVLAIAVVVAAVYGIVDEVHQSFVPERAFELADIAADVLGGFLGAAILTAARGRGEERGGRCDRREAS